MKIAIARRATFVVVIIFTGCTMNPYNVRTLTQSTPTTRHVFDKNYVLGREQTAFVGEPVVRVKDYYVEVRSTPTFTSPVEMQTSWWAGQDQQYPVGFELRAEALMNVDGTEYYIAEPVPPLYRGLGMVVDMDGHYRGKIMARGGFFATACDLGAVCIKPNQIDFKSTQGGPIVSGRGFVNFEIVYSGTSKDTFNLLYREYTPNDMARPAFTQNLTYDRGSPSIRFRDLRIRILNASNESLSYVVEADGIRTEDSK